MPNQNKFPHASKLFDWLFVVFSGLNVAGGYIDGWAHTHLDRIDTFFTPYHGLFYASFTILLVLLANSAIKNHGQGYPWKYALPREYRFAAFGMILFGLAGVGDLLWHTFFGIEAGMDALLSPTHLLLSFGGAMMVSGPLHAIWYRDATVNKPQAFPIVLSFCYVLMTICFMTQFLHPFAIPWMAHSSRQLIANADYARILGIADILVFTAVFMGMVLTVIRNWKFPTGAFTLILSLNALAITLMRAEHYVFIATAAVAGALVDFVYHDLVDKLAHPRYLRLFGLVVPMIITACYVLTVLITGGTWWSVHFVFGSIVISGLAGSLMTYILVPPESPVRQ